MYRRLPVITIFLEGHLTSTFLIGIAPALAEIDSYIVVIDFKICVFCIFPIEMRPDFLKIVNTKT